MASRASTAAGKRRASGRAAHAKRARAAPRSHRSRNGSSNRPKRAAKAKAGAPRKPTKPKRSAGSAAKRKPTRSPTRLRAPSVRTTLIVLPLLAAGLAAGYFGWLRDSSLVAVREVEVSGLAGPEAQEATAALTAAAKEMTTLNVDSEQLAAAVEGFPTVAGLRADAGFPNSLAIVVEERPPVLVARSGGEGVPVAGDGTLLRGVELAEGSEGLPAIDIRELPAERLAGEPLAMALVLGAAPQPLRELVEDVSYTDENGVEVILRGQIPVRFGTGARAADKWAAAAAVLADPRLKELSYVDVRVPERPAVGGAAPPATEDEAVTGTETTATAPTAPLATEPDPVVGP